MKKWLKSVYIYGSYREIKTGVSLFWTTLYKKNKKKSKYKKNAMFREIGFNASSF